MKIEVVKETSPLTETVYYWVSINGERKKCFHTKELAIEMAKEIAKMPDINTKYETLFTIEVV